MFICEKCYGAEFAFWNDEPIACFMNGLSAQKWVDNHTAKDDLEIKEIAKKFLLMQAS